MSEQHYICDKYGKRLPEAELVPETDPDLYQQPLREVCFKIREDRGDPVPPMQLYHRCHAYRRFGGTSHFYLCGPMHPETEQEYFIHWTGSSMERGDRRG